MRPACRFHTFPTEDPRALHTGPLTPFCSGLQVKETVRPAAGYVVVRKAASGGTRSRLAPKPRRNSRRTECFRIQGSPNRNPVPTKKRSGSDTDNSGGIRPRAPFHLNWRHSSNSEPSPAFGTCNLLPTHVVGDPEFNATFWTHSHIRRLGSGLRRQLLF